MGHVLRLWLLYLLKARGTGSNAFSIGAKGGQRKVPADAPDWSTAPVLRDGAARKSGAKGLRRRQIPGVEEDSELCDDEQNEFSQVIDDGDRGNWDIGRTERPR